MLAERVEQLKAEYVGQYVVIDGDRPELTRFLNKVGQVKTINFNGQALVEFDADNSRARHDIGLDYLKVVDKPAPPPEKAKPAAKKADSAPAPIASDDKSGSAESVESKPDAKLSPLEVARMKKEEAEPADKRESSNTPTKSADDRQ